MSGILSFYTTPDKTSFSTFQSHLKMARLIVFYPRCPSLLSKRKKSFGTCNAFTL